MPDMELKIGDTLPNGATLVDIKQNSRGDYYVLCLYVGNAPYVTWHLDPDIRSCHWGNYFQTLEAAIEDLKQRAQ